MKPESGEGSKQVVGNFPLLETGMHGGGRKTRGAAKRLTFEELESMEGRARTRGMSASVAG